MDFPLLHSIMIDLYNPLIAIAASFIFVWTILSLEERTVRYQINKISFAILLSLLGAFVSTMHSSVAMTGGRWWFFFPFFTTGWNDAMAYFAGVAFGKHKLIGLSPNKTLEGFIGALIFNFTTTVCLSNRIHQDAHFWMCAPKRYTLPFENYECETLPKIYTQMPYTIPFVDIQIMMSPVVKYCILYCAFSALIAPFAGFFASGMKRAYKIKDFSDTLPGHGGVVDRFDCICLTTLFNYLMLSQLILVDDYQVESVIDSSRGLAVNEKIEIVNMLA